MLRVARRLGQTLPLTVQATCLAAHALPPEFAGRADDYIDDVARRILPVLAAEGLVDAVDAFCEHLAFSPAQVDRVFQAARHLGLPVKLHAEQLSSLHGATLAAGYGALSADHLEHATESDVLAMAGAGTVAVLLPGAFYALRETRLPPLELLRRHGVPIAISSDLNPGTSPALSLRLMLSMACTLFRMTPEEALAGATAHAARALGLQATHGELAAGRVADFVAWDIGHPSELAYWIGGDIPKRVIRHAGEVDAMPLD
jgi:imidazolonepropionase